MLYKNEHLTWVARVELLMSASYLVVVGIVGVADAGIQACLERLVRAMSDACCEARDGWNHAVLDQLRTPLKEKRFLCQ